MSLKNTFCSSPWIHMRITNAGHYDYCRWSTKVFSETSIRDQSPADFFQNSMTPIRQQLLDGEMPAGCQECQHMEQHSKISGRQKQLLKIGVQLSNFEKTMLSSPWVQEFSQGPSTQQLPQDWQIDLGNYCNSACLFCTPRFSSKLATEHLKLGLIKQLPASNWTDSPELIDRFVATLKQSPHIQYLHFIGGETLITPAFQTMLQALIDMGLNHKATIGFTTNLSTWRSDIVELLSRFQSVHLGMSIESFTPVNAYVRWPVRQETVIENLERWIEVGKERGWLMQFRTTPTCLTVKDLITVYDYAWTHKIAVESCNFLNKPEVLRPAVLPLQYRKPIIKNLKQWLSLRGTVSDPILNTRHLDHLDQQLLQDLTSYVNYFENEQDQSWRLPELIAYLKTFEPLHNNSILDYLPEYEDLFRSAGY